ncbi:MAG: hypothetical protein J3K34DRAFT_522405 [Monoraphidium minutum]|nr:MAG: hypothetical protein J3K34DRAFT_522405 [Monoraphidium minutum]
MMQGVRRLRAAILQAGGLSAAGDEAQGAAPGASSSGAGARGKTRPAGSGWARPLLGGGAWAPRGGEAGAGPASSGGSSSGGGGSGGGGGARFGARALHTGTPRLPAFGSGSGGGGGGISGGGGAGAPRHITLAASDAAPRPLPRYRRLRGADDPSKWKRMVVRVPPQVQVTHDEAANALVLTGRSGAARVALTQLDPTGLVAMQLYLPPPGDASAAFGALLLLASPSKRYFRGIQSHIDNAVHGVMQGYLVGVAVKGVGYRLEPADGCGVISSPPGAPPSARRLFWEPGGEKVNVVYPHKQPSRVVRLKVGFTHSAIYKLPEGVAAFFVKPTLVYLYGVDKALVTGAAAALRAVRPPNAYTGNGVALLGEETKLRQRAGSK